MPLTSDDWQVGDLTFGKEILTFTESGGAILGRTTCNLVAPWDLEPVSKRTLGARIVNEGRRKIKGRYRQ